MIYRFMYQGYADGPVKRRKNSGAEQVALAEYNGSIFLYYESQKADLMPEAVAEGPMRAYPDGSCWRRMPEIFHYSRPLSAEHWRRKIPGKTPEFRVNYIQLEKIASYIYYHYQYQEEMPGDGDKYGAIFISGNMLVMYLEHPAEQETERYAGSLETHNTPHAQWGAVMDAHFLPWENGKKEWRKINLMQEESNDVSI